MSNREPQVGDVRAIKYASEYCPYVLVEIYGELHRQRLDMISCPCWHHTEFGECDMKYLGKLAPRYKRLFGIYYIKDKSNDQ